MQSIDRSSALPGWVPAPVTRRSALALLGVLPAWACVAAEPSSKERGPQPIERVFGPPTRGVLALPARRCLVEATVISSLSGVTIRGVAGRTVLAIASGPIVLRLGDCSDVVFEDIVFESGFSAKGEFTYGLVTAADVHIRRVRFVRCTFSVPNVAINAIHLVLDHRGSAESVHFEDCVISSAGRMGLEVQNHGNNDPRYDDIRWTGGRIANTGLRHAMGMGLSLSGFGTGCVIDTVFENNLYAAIEGVGVSSSTFTARFQRQERAVDILSFTGDRPMQDNVIRGCRTSGIANGNVLLRQQQGLRMSENDLALAGGVMCRDINGITVSNDRYATAGSSSLFVESTPRIGSADNRWLNCTFDNSRSTRPFSTVRFRAPQTRDNTVQGTQLIRGPGGVDADNLDGAARNRVTMIDADRRQHAVLG